MLASAKETYEQHPVHQSRLKRLFDKLSDFSIRLSPYFDVVNILVSSHPEYSALVWGSIRFLFQVSIHRLFLSQMRCLILNAVGNQLQWVR